MPLDVGLGREAVAAWHLHGVMNVRRAAGVGNGLDGAEQVFTRGSRGESPEALEVLVPFVTVATASVQVGPVVIGLPDFNDSVSDRFSIRTQDPPTQVSHFTHGWGEVVVQDQQIVVGVERQMIGVEGPFRLRGSLDQFLSQQPGDRQQQ